MHKHLFILLLYYTILHEKCYTVSIRTQISPLIAFVKKDYQRNKEVKATFGGLMSHCPAAKQQLAPFIRNFDGFGDF